MISTLLPNQRPSQTPQIVPPYLQSRSPQQTLQVCRTQPKLRNSSLLINRRQVRSVSSDLLTVLFLRLGRLL